VTDVLSCEVELGGSDLRAADDRSWKFAAVFPEMGNAMMGARRLVTAALSRAGAERVDGQWKKRELDRARAGAME